MAALNALCVAKYTGSKARDFSQPKEPSMEIIVPDDYDRVYTDHPALARLSGRGTVRVFNDPPTSEDALIAVTPPRRF